MTDIIDKLREIEEAVPGGPMPKCLEIAPGTPQGLIAEHGDIKIILASNNWGVALSKIAGEARAEIERLRAQATSHLGQMREIDRL